MKKKITKMGRPLKVMGGFATDADKRHFRRMMMEAQSFNEENKSRRRVLELGMKDAVSANNTVDVV